MIRAWLSVLTLCAGCGYHFAGAGTNVPESASTIAIRPFGNRTTAYGIEVYVRRAIEDEFRRRGTLRVVADGEAPDVVLSGTIRSLESNPVAFSGNAEALRYVGVMVVGVRLVERESGRVLYENRALQETQDFGAVSGVVVTSSPTFQRGTIDARDLAALTNVQLGESQRNAALEDLLDRLARDVYASAMEGF